MTNELYNFLINEIKIRPSDLKLPAKTKQNMLCLLCGKIYQTSASARKMNFLKHKTLGCSNCSRMSKMMKIRLKNLEKLKKDFIIISQTPEMIKYRDNITVKNISCDHEFTTKLDYLLSSGVKCPTCEKMRIKSQGFLYKDKSIVKKLRFTEEEFVSRLNERNEKHDDCIRCVDSSVYKGMLIKMQFVCEKNHLFETMPNNILNLETGCPICAVEKSAFRYNLKYSQKAIEWMNYISLKENIFIQHAGNSKEYVIHHPSGRYFYADGYCKENNTIYEFHGSIFHGDPTLYRKNEKIHPYKDEITAGELYESTIEREKLIKECGYNLIVMWESEWDKMKNDLKNYQQIFKC